MTAIGPSRRKPAVPLQASPDVHETRTDEFELISAISITQQKLSRPLKALSAHNSTVARQRLPEKLAQNGKVTGLDRTRGGE